MQTSQFLLDGQLGDAVGVFRVRRRLFGHRQLGAGPVDGDRGGEHEALDAVIDRRVDQVDAADQVVGVVEALDEVAQAFGGVGGQVKDVVEPIARRTGGRPASTSLMLPWTNSRAGGDVVREAAAQIVEDGDAGGRAGAAVLGDVRADEPGAAGDERAHACSSWWSPRALPSLGRASRRWYAATSACIS